MSRKIKKICKYCENEFWVFPSETHRNFCSRAHYWEYRKLPIEAKACGKCEEVKPISEFSKSNTGRPGRDGYRAECKSCQSKYRRKWYQDNREDQIEYAKSYIANRPGIYKEKYAKNRDKIIERKRRYDNENRQLIRQRSRERYWKDPQRARDKIKKWAKNNNEKIKIQRRKYREQNRDKVRVGIRRFYRNNPGKTHEYQNRRRAAKLNNGGSYTTQEWEFLCEFYGHICLRCGTHANDTPEGKLSPDHVIPLSRGGSNDISNIQPLCYTCNLQKHTSATDYRPNQFQPRFKQLSFDL